MKTCKRCGLLKELDMFSIHNRFSDGRNSVCKMCKSKEQSDRYKSGKSVPTPYSYKKQLQRYGLTVGNYEELCSKQNHKCAICEREVQLVVDHCHETSKVRGLLCQRCNTGLGKLGDNLDSLNKAVKYLTNNIASVC